MMHILIMLLIAPLAIADSVKGLPLWTESTEHSWVLIAVPALLLLPALVFHAFAAHCARQIDRTGRRAWVVRVDAARVVLWVVLALLFWTAVIGAGWLQSVRRVVGDDAVLLDEAIAVLPVLAAIVWGWWAMEPVERRLRDAALLRHLDEGRPVHAFPSRSRFVMGHVRHELLIVLVPLALLAALSDVAPMVVEALARRWNWLNDPGRMEVAAGLARLAGAVLVLLFSPLMLPLLWRTSRLPAGPLRDMLSRACLRHRVKFRDILVWRTGGTVMNAAVVGAAGPLRFVLLTDALLEALPQEQTEAVMAHEIAHARLAHVPWLLAAIMAGAALAWYPTGWAELRLADWLSQFVDARGPAERVIDALRGGVLSMIASVLAGIVVVGWVSRRFERQADAFAVRHLSTAGASHAAARGAPIGPDAARAMAGALGEVAALNGIDPAKFTFRHGSIRDRQQRILSLVGVRSDRLPIDRTVAVMKAAIAIGLIGAIAASMLTGSF